MQVTHFNNLRTLFIQSSKRKDSEGFLTCLSATLWTIWFTRNVSVFKNLKMENNTIFNMIKLRSWEWSMSNRLIQDKWFTLWNHNPQVAYSNNKKEELRDLLERWFSQNSLVGFIDGAADMGSSGPRAGMGGFLMDKQNRTWFIYSGPSPFLTEHKAEEYCNDRDFR